jgi:hypothetical protein
VRASDENRRAPLPAWLGWRDGRVGNRVHVTLSPGYPTTQQFREEGVGRGISLHCCPSEKRGRSDLHISVGLAMRDAIRRIGTNRSVFLTL